MKDLNAYKPNPEESDDHPYNQKKGKPDPMDKYFRYTFYFILFMILFMFAHRIYEGGNFFDVVGSFFPDSTGSWY